MSGRLDWKGEEVQAEVLGRLALALGEIGLRVEAEAKQELKKGHGVLTGTLRRSIHTALPGYVWQSDDVPPSAGTPERGGQRVSGLVVEVGSGLHYALAVHQGHGRFRGYRYITRAVERVQPRVLEIVRRYVG